jgi:antirestriction protein ArdC
MTLEKLDIYARITNQIIADLEKGVRPWMKPWSADHLAGRVTRPLRHNGQPYQGVNILMLWVSACAQGFTRPHWMTYNQAQELGGQVRKGEKGSLVVYANRITKTEKDDKGDEVEREIPFLKGYTVFNLDQIEGLAPDLYPAPEPLPAPAFDRIAQAEAFFAATGATIREGGNRAFYSPATDHIQMPPFASFQDAESHAATLAHELTHWTKAPSRLDRDFGRKRFGDEGYAREELVAELGAAFLCADLGITPEIRADHAAYIDNWLKVLKEDKRAIFSAASHATRAADYLHSLQKKEEQQQAA